MFTLSSNVYMKDEISMGCLDFVLWGAESHSGTGKILPPGTAIRRLYVLKT